MSWIQNKIQEILMMWAKESRGKQPIALHLARIALYELKDADALYPNVKEKYVALSRRMSELRKPVFLVEGFRSAKKQNDLSAGVTNAKGLQSYHQYGLAFDVAFKVYGWNPPKHSWWDTLGREGKALGLTWGGDFPNFFDGGHLEYHPSFTWRDLKPYFE